jgi:hypothetical protein
MLADPEEHNGCHDERRDNYAPDDRENEPSSLVRRPDRDDSGQMSSARNDPPILVVGAGPVGLVLAVDLARRGGRVRIIDTLEAPTTESRAILLHAGSLDQLELAGVGARIIATGIKSAGVQFHTEGKRLAHIPLDTVDSRHPFSLTTAQTETERVLTERLGELGVGIERGVTLTGLEQDRNEVRATLRRASGSTDVIVAPWLAGTDGARGSVRGLVGLKLEGAFKGEHFLMGDVDADCDHDRGAIHIFFAANQATGLLFPMVGRRVRVFAQIPDGVDVIAFSTLLTDMGTVSSSFLRHLRDAAVRTAFATSRAQHLMANEIEEQNVRYRGSAIVAGNGADTKSGDFFRDGDDAPVTHALQAPDVAARVAHLAIVLPGRNGARPSFQIPEAVETVTFADPNDIFAKRVGLGSAGGLVLVRPDGYIGLIAPPTDVDAANNYFACLMR